MKFLTALKCERDGPPTRLFFRSLQILQLSIHYIISEHTGTFSGFSAQRWHRISLVANMLYAPRKCNPSSQLLPSNNCIWRPWSLWIVLLLLSEMDTALYKEIELLEKENTNLVSNTQLCDSRELIRKRKNLVSYNPLNHFCGGKKIKDAWMCSKAVPKCIHSLQFSVTRSHMPGAMHI